MTEDRSQEGKDRPADQAEADRKANEEEPTPGRFLRRFKSVLAEIGIVKRLIRAGPIVVLG